MVFVEENIWGFFYKDDFGVLQEVVVGQDYFFFVEYRVVVQVLFFYEGQFLG